MRKVTQEAPVIGEREVTQEEPVIGERKVMFRTSGKKKRLMVDGSLWITKSSADKWGVSC